MIAVRVENVSIRSGKRFRHNQNYTFTLWRLNDNIGPSTSVKDIKNIIEEKLAKKLQLNQNSVITILSNSYEQI